MGLGRGVQPSASILCYSDDTALIVTGKSVEDIRNKEEVFLNRIIWKNRKEEIIDSNK